MTTKTISWKKFGGPSLHAPSRAISLRHLWFPSMSDCTEVCVCFFFVCLSKPRKKKLKKFYAKSKTICESNNLHITYYGWGANSQWLREDTRILCIQVTIQWGFQISRSGLTFGIVQLRQKLVPRLSWLWNHLDRTYSFSPWRIVSLGASSYATCVPYNKK